MVFKKVLYAYKRCICLRKNTNNSVILKNCISILILIFKNVIYSCYGKAEFSAAMILFPLRICL